MYVIRTALFSTGPTGGRTRGLVRRVRSPRGREPPAGRGEDPLPEIPLNRNDRLTEERLHKGFVVKPLPATSVPQQPPSINYSLTFVAIDPGKEGHEPGRHDPRRSAEQPGCG